MWQRFTERARRAILMAQEEAGRLQSSKVGTEHLLLALLCETDSPASQFLHTAGLTPEAVRKVVTQFAPPSTTPPSQVLSQNAKNILVTAAQEAQELGHGDIDSHHLLLALLGNPQSEACRVLRHLQQNPQELHAGLLEQLKEYRASAQPNAVPDAAPVSPNTSLFQRFTERSRRVILLAQEEAGQMQSGYIGPEHLFLGLVCENEGAAAQMLMRMGVKADTVRNAIEALGEDKQKNSCEMALTSQAKRVLELSAEEARELHHNFIGTEHLLLAMLHPECGLAPLLKKLDLKGDDIRQQVLEYLGPSATVTAVPEKSSDSAWVRFDEHTQRVLTASHTEAMRLQSDFILPQHLLLALAEETSGVIGQLWQEYEITPELLRQSIEQQDWPADDVVQPDSKWMFSLKSLRILELTADEARRMRSRKIGREHLLLGLLRSKNNPAANVLTQWGMKLDDVRELARHFRE